MPLYRINNHLVFFVHIPKTGGSSIEASLESKGSVCLSKKIDCFPAPFQHLHAELFQRLVPDDFYDKGFAVCRNPYSRLISEYRHQIIRGRVTQMTVDSWIENVFRKYKRDPFLKHNHIRPQSEFICNSIEVFKFEDGLESVVKGIYSFCGISSYKVHHNKKRYKKTPIQLKMSSLEKIRKFYQVDFDVFRYDPEDYTFVEKDQVVLI